MGFDRFSDLIRIEKEIGKKLRGKNMMVVSNSFEDTIEDTFYFPFIKSAEYLGMDYLGHLHINANIPLEHQNINFTH